MARVCHFSSALFIFLAVWFQSCYARIIPDGDLDIMPCPQRNTTFRLSLFSRRNETGDWNTQIRVNRDYNDDSRDREFQIKAKQTTAVCNCTAEIVLVETEVIAPPPLPDSDYQLVPDLGYYKFHDEPKTWYQAQHICCSEDSHLAIANSPEEAQHISAQLASLSSVPGLSSTKHLFMGFHDAHTQGNHLTIFGEDLNRTGYNEWAASHQPGTNSECGSIRNDGVLDDVPCDWKLAFVCEHELW